MTPSIPISAHPTKWEERWSAGRIGWDQGAVHPAIARLLGGGHDSSSDSLVGDRNLDRQIATNGTSMGRYKTGDELGIARKGRALVPGCGMGYDVDLLARRGLDAVGLDLAPTGVKAARDYLASCPPISSGGSATIEQADFFTHDPESGSGSGSGGGEGNENGGKYDVILDYTFLCALPPTSRLSWLNALTALSHPSPSTRLITLMFPLFSPDSRQVLDPISAGGPPFALSVKTYHELLDERWELIWSREIDADRGKGEGRVRGPEGGEMLGVWAWRGRR